MNNYFVILAAGKGKRFNSKKPKNSVILDRIIMKTFFFKKSAMFKNYSI